MKELVTHLCVFKIGLGSNIARLRIDGFIKRIKIDVVELEILLLDPQCNLAADSSADVRRGLRWPGKRASFYLQIFFFFKLVVFSSDFTRFPAEPQRFYAAIFTYAVVLHKSCKQTLMCEISTLLF